MGRWVFVEDEAGERVVDKWVVVDRINAMVYAFDKYSDGLACLISLHETDGTKAIGCCLCKIRVVAEVCCEVFDPQQRLTKDDADSNIW